jgi:hypothetical protein
LYSITGYEVLSSTLFAVCEFRKSFFCWTLQRLLRVFKSKAKTWLSFFWTLQRPLRVFSKAKQALRCPLLDLAAPAASFKSEAGASLSFCWTLQRPLRVFLKAKQALRCPFAGPCSARCEF